MRCVRMKAWTGNTEAEQEQRLLRGFVLSLPQPSGLVVAPVTCGALGLSRLSEEQRASEEPFCLSTPPRQAERATHGQDLPALPPCKHPCGSNTHYPAPRTPTKLLDKLPAPLWLGLVCCLAADTICCCSMASTQVGWLLCSAAFFFCSTLSTFRKHAVFTFGLIEKPCFACSTPARD